MEKRVLILGAGPAGIGAAAKLAKHNLNFAIVEKENQVGGLSKTIKKDGILFDIGPHRFFTKIKAVEKLWRETLGKDLIKVKRLTRIHYQGKFFDYPLNIKKTLKNLGAWESFLCLSSLAKAKLFPYRDEKTFDRWITNRFGHRLFNHFFKSYTEKLWGIPCNKLQSEWGGQRIKDLSLWELVKNAVPLGKKKIIKSLIEEFDYPVNGAGMMYETILEQAITSGDRLFLNSRVISIKAQNSKIISALIKTPEGIKEIEADYFISSLPITELVRLIQPEAPSGIISAANQLKYRNYITASPVYKEKINLKDNWLYIHSPKIKSIRIHIRNNWGPNVVRDKRLTALGVEYFCDQDDQIWRMSDEELLKLSDRSVKELGLIQKKSKMQTSLTIRYPKAYPVYTPLFQKNLKKIKKFISGFKNLQTIGRYGMFRYNNMDHSVYTGMLAAKNVVFGNKYNLWQINQDQEYHETKKSSQKN